MKAVLLPNTSHRPWMEAQRVKHLARGQSWVLKHNFLTPSLMLFAGPQNCLTEVGSVWEENTIFKSTSEERIEGLGEEQKVKSKGRAPLGGFAGRQKVAQEPTFT